MKLRAMLALLLVFTIAFGQCALAAEFDQSQTIAVVSREEGSGTRGAFIELTGIATKDAAGAEIDNTYAEADFVNGTSLVMTTVSFNEYAVGYASLSSVEGNGTIKALKVNGVVATTENILNGTYAIARPFNIVTVDAMQDPIALDFLAFIMSKEGQAVVADNKLVTVTTEATPNYAAANLSGSVSVGGSTSVAPVMEKLKEAYEALNPSVKVDIQSTGSTAGVINALNGTYQIGMASRSLKDSELASGAKGIVIAMDGICVIVHPANPLEDITLEQVRQVFVGEITTWADLNI